MAIKFDPSLVRPADPEGVEDLELWSLIAEKPARIKYAEEVAVRIMHEVETSPVHQMHPKNRVLPIVDKEFEEVHHALGIKAHAKQAFESSIIEIQFRSGTKVRLLVSATHDSANGITWATEAANVDYYLNHKREKRSLVYNDLQIAKLMKG